MAITNSPNMNLPVPGVGNEIGPDYANDVNNCFSILDGHTHSIGSGVQITPDGLTINSDLPFLNNNAIGIRSVRLQDQGGVLSGGSDLGCLYNNGGNLYYNDSAGNQIAITSGGGVAGTPGSIANLVAPASATYTAASKLFTWASGTSGKAAAMDNGAVTIRQTDTASAKGITLASPNALGADYQLTLPTGLPGSTQYLSCDTSGNIGTVTANDIAIAVSRPTGSVVGAEGVAISSSSGNYSTNSTVYVDVTNLSITITTSGRPVVLYLNSDGTTGASIGLSGTANSTAGVLTGNIKFLRDGASIGDYGIEGTTLNGILTATTWPGGFNFLDPVGAGTYTYKIQTRVISANVVSPLVKISFLTLVAYEL